MARQLDGLVRDADHPDAPVVPFQAENELYDQPDHLATPRAMAETVSYTHLAVYKRQPPAASLLSAAARSCSAPRSDDTRRCRRPASRT